MCHSYRVTLVVSSIEKGAWVYCLFFVHNGEEARQEEQEEREGHSGLAVYPVTHSHWYIAYLRQYAETFI